MGRGDFIKKVSRIAAVEGERATSSDRDENTRPEWFPPHDFLCRTYKRNPFGKAWHLGNNNVIESKYICVVCMCVSD